MRPHSSLLCDRPCRSNFGASTEDGLARTFQKVLYMRVSIAHPWHSQNCRFLPSSASKPSCRGIVARVLTSRRRQVAPVVRIGRAIGSDIQSKRKHTDTLVTETGSQKGGSQRVHAKQYTQRGVTLLNPLYNTSRKIRQVEYRSPLYT